MNKPKLVIIPSDSLEDYNKKGYSSLERRAYYNPNNAFDVTLLGFQEKGNSPFEYAGFQVYPFNENPDHLDNLNSWEELKYLGKLKDVLSILKPDLIRGYGGFWSGRLAGEIGRYLKIPSVLSVHDLQPTNAVLTTDRVFCVSEAVRDKCLELGLDHSKTRILLDRVNTDLFKSYRGSTELESLKRKYSAKNITVSAGRLVWEKNIERLIDATEIVRKELGDYCHIHLGGFGNLKEPIEAKAKSFPHFNILPNLPQGDLAKYYSLADAFVMASLSEGFGLVYIEALSCETPVVTSDSSPMNSYVKDGFNGLLVNPNSSNDIAKKTLELLTSHELYSRLRLNARPSIKRFDSKELEKREAELYFELFGC